MTVRASASVDCSTSIFRLSFDLAIADSFFGGWLVLAPSSGPALFSLPLGPLGWRGRITQKLISGRFDSQTPRVIQAPLFDLIRFALNFMDRREVTDHITEVHGVTRRPEIEFRAVRRPFVIVE